jgi:hypothetical protein
VTDIDDVAALDARTRRRLERFAEAFELIDASAYMTLAEARPGHAVERAQADAVQRLGSGRRQRAARAAVAVFTQAATVAYARRTSLPDTLMLFQSLPDRAEDRVRFLASVERAVVAIILWDELSEDDRQALAGPWAARIEAVVGDVRRA